MLLMKKKPIFIHSLYETWSKYPNHELINLPEYQLDWVKIVDLYYWSISGPVEFFASVSISSLTHGEKNETLFVQLTIDRKKHHQTYSN